MDREQIKAYLNTVTWTSFRAAMADVMAADENSTPVVAGMYSQVRQGKIFPSRVENFFYTLIVSITPYWLLAAKWLVAPWAYGKKARELRLSRSSDFGPGGKTADILIVLTAALPSIYESLYRVLAHLDRGEGSVAALLFPPMLKFKRADLKALRRCPLVSLYDELVQLTPGEIFTARRRARGQYRELASRVKEERLKALFDINQRLVRLLFMFDNLYEAAYRRILSRLNIKIVVDNWFNGAMRKVTRELGLHTVMLQHGTQWGEDEEGVTQDEDELVIWGEYWRENFRKLVLPKVQLQPLGCPRFDAIIEALNKPRDPRFYETMKIHPDRWTVTFLSQSHGFEFPESTRLVYVQVTKALAEMVEARKDELNFIIKLHPHDDAAYYDKVFSPEIRARVRFLKNEVPLYDLFRHSDVAITVNSTAILESIAMDLPSIQFACEGLVDWIDFCSDGGGFLVRTGADLIRVIDQLRTNEDFREEARRRRRSYIPECLANLGQATEKMAAHLLETAGRLKATR